MVALRPAIFSKKNPVPVDMANQDAANVRTFHEVVDLLMKLEFTYRNNVDLTGSNKARITTIQRACYGLAAKFAEI